ncbi:cytochrome P450 [Cyathus striatus]|nr:cytochrome P450 [Cyathus striatus]
MLSTLLSDVLSQYLPIAGIFVGTLTLYSLFTSQTWKLRHIPTAGFSGLPLLSYISALQFIFRGDTLLKEAHERYRGQPFKVAYLTEWFVVMNSGPEDIQIASKWPDSVAQFYPFLDTVIRPPYTIGSIIIENANHTLALVSRLTRNMSFLIPKMKDELEVAIQDMLSPTDEWKGFSIDETSMKLVSRLIARMIVGEDLCRNQKFLELCKEYPLTVFKTALIINLLLPKPLRPFVHLITKGTTPIVQATMKLIAPIVERSRLWQNEKGIQLDGIETSMDWMIELASGDAREFTLESMARRVLHLSFASLHTLSISFQRTLYCICKHPEHIPVLREEIEEIVSNEGWSKVALEKMRKLESFIQETGRLMPLGIIQPARCMVQDHMLSDGTLVPQGTTVVFASDVVLMDEEVYPNPDKFDPLRFYNLEEDGKKISMTNPNKNFTMFGAGRHACPGRFIATLEVKLMIALLVMNYDIKLRPGTVVGSGRSATDVFQNSPHIPANTGHFLIKNKDTT